MSLTEMVETPNVSDLYAYLYEIEVSENQIDQEHLTRIQEKFEQYFRTFELTEDTEKRNILSVKSTAKGTIPREVILKVCKYLPPEMEDKDEIPIKGESLLLRAMAIKTGNDLSRQTLKKIISTIIRSCPELITLEKEDEDIKGVSAIHLAVLQQDVNLLKEMADSINKGKSDNKTSKRFEIKCAQSPSFDDTELMAGTLLGIAALTCNEKIFKLILTEFDSIDCTNQKGDSIIHSLIKFAHVQPGKLEPITKMLNYVINCKFLPVKHNFATENMYKNKIAEVLMIKNKEKLTPLQLAARRQQFELFETILEHEVYTLPKSNFFQDQHYDITEIETIPLEIEDKGNEKEDIKTDHHESVLEYVVHHRTLNAFRFSNITPVKDVISEKWNVYRCYFHAWFFVHFIFMLLLSFAAVRRSLIQINLGANNTVQYKYHVTNDVSVTCVSALGLVFALFYILIECRIQYRKRFRSKTSKKFEKRLKEHFSLPYSNFMFRIYFVTLSLVLAFDFLFAVLAGRSSTDISGYENYCLIFAIIIGWYLVLFFLQTFKIFSFYTVLIQKVILDMLKFACVMIIFLVAFSIAMFMIMQGAETNDDDFETLEKTAVKMLTIMLGIGELGVLFQARQPILAVFVFVLFVLLTTILLLNALIAMMSNSCTDLMSNSEDVVATKMHYRLQKLSVILYLESFLLDECCAQVGRKVKGRRIWKPSVKILDVNGIEPSNDLLELTDNNRFGTNSIYKLKEMLKLPHGIERSKNGKRNQTAPLEIPKIRKYIDIKDYSRQQCNQCKNGSLTLLESQEITEHVQKY